MRIADLQKIDLESFELFTNILVSTHWLSSLYTPNQVYRMKWGIENAMPELANEEKEIHNH